jgi:demethylmenaquinone methyltransferase/2-methoxy-6-polyprenyl-1,4-benzoquinol methylase
VLLDRLGPSGHIIAVDISPDMLKRARQKIRDPRVVWFQAPASRVPVEDISCDRVICFSSWPHFRNQTAVIREFHRVLKRNGFIHILHFMSREEVNRIHGQAHPSVYEDQLVPIEEVTALFEQNGFSLFETFDDAHRYLLTVQKEQ